jgi:hypothetical protein
MKRPTAWPWVRPFLILLVVIALPPLVYWFGYVHSRTADERRLAYSTLSAITADFRNRLIAYDKIVKSTDDYGDHGHPYLAAYLSSIFKAQYKKLPPAGNEAANRLDVRPETGDLLLLAKDGSDNGAVHAAPVPLNALLAWEIVKTQFDGLLVVAPGNQLIAQDRRLPEQPLGQQVAQGFRGLASVHLCMHWPPWLSQCCCSRSTASSLTFWPRRREARRHSGRCGPFTRLSRRARRLPRSPLDGSVYTCKQTLCAPMQPPCVGNRPKR